MNTFTKNVLGTWGKQGQQWLDQLPTTLEHLSRHWKLCELSPVGNMTYNYVARAVKGKDHAVVLKVSCDAKLIKAEHQTLKHFAGRGAIEVIDYSSEHNALLLEQAIAGDTLKSQHQNLSQTIKHYAAVVEALFAIEKPQSGYPHVSEWCKALDQINDPRIPDDFTTKAKALSTHLIKSAQDERLCHGDLHLDNILQHQDTYLAIDPKGVIAEKAFEVAWFDLNLKLEPHNVDDTAQIADTLCQLASTLALPFDRLLAWVFIRFIISSQWHIEDDGNPEQTLRLAEHVHQLFDVQAHTATKSTAERYNQISNWYKKHRSNTLFERPYLDKIIVLCPPNAQLLDLGCGNGQPITEFFTKKGYQVTAVDNSIEQIKAARLNLPEVKLIHSNMTDLQLNKRFDCILCWHSFFHLLKDEQRKMFAVFTQHINPGGILLFTTGTTDSEVWSNNGNHMLYHASLSPEEYTSLLENHGFRILSHTVEDPSCAKATVWIAEFQKTRT